MVWREKKNIPTFKTTSNTITYFELRVSKTPKVCPRNNISLGTWKSVENESKQSTGLLKVMIKIVPNRFCWLTTIFQGTSAVMNLGWGLALFFLFSIIISAYSKIVCFTN